MKPQRASRRFKITRWMFAITLGIAVVIGVLAMLSLAVPVQTRRTGRAPVKPLAYSAGSPELNTTDRIWIDTDAACGAGQRNDPDDCFAIILLLKARGAHIAGISTVFSNASLAVTEATTKNLFIRMGQEKIMPSGFIQTHRFYPFDLAAAAYVLQPAAFDCATAHALVMRDQMVWTSWF